jgi:hypothetical protein
MPADFDAALRAHLQAIADRDLAAYATVLLRSTYTEADEAGRPTLEARNLVGLTFVAAAGDWLLVHDQNTPERPAG